ncbi:hypothetical protein ABFZ85_06480 [Hyphococcus formosus]|uniref:hypothetical protein n=1 Tax=Hyphococcus formosus TaxID=3143534 RepID=UPI00398AEF06
MTSTKEELLRRLRDRPMPQISSELSPANDTARYTRLEVNRENERRIAQLRNSLSKAQESFELQHSFVRLDGYAAAQFEKER